MNKIFSRFMKIKAGERQRDGFDLESEVEIERNK